MGITSEIAGAAAGMFVVMMVVYLLGFGISIAAYVLQSLGYYTIAQRRGIKHPWMAWVPLLNLWILGSISDQYRYVARGQIRNRRKVLLGVAIGMAVCCVALFAAYIVMMFNMLSNIDMINTMVTEQMLSAMTGSFVTLGIVGFVSWVLTNSGLCNTGRLGAQALYGISTPVSSSNAQPGDLVFFVGTYDTPGISHVGIYVGGGMMLHCGDPIQYANLNTSYWQSHFYAFARPPYE